VPVEIARHLLVRLALEIAQEHLRLEVAEILLDPLLDVFRDLLVDDQFLGVDILALAMTSSSVRSLSSS